MKRHCTAWGVLAFLLNQLASLLELPALNGFFDGFFGGCGALRPRGRSPPEQAQGQDQRGQATGMAQEGQAPWLKGEKQHGQTGLKSKKPILSGECPGTQLPSTFR
jgi:hypothetical protein